MSPNRGEYTKHKNPQTALRLCFLVFIHKQKQVLLVPKTKNPQLLLWVFFCGERGIRTPGGVTLNSFQDCRIRPLCHFSLANANIHSIIEVRKLFLRNDMLILALQDDRIY